MPRQRDLNDIPTGRRIFIKSSDWEAGETRRFYYNGYEKTEQISKKSGKPYTQYLFYLLPIEGKEDKPGDEVTLSIFPNQAAAFKDAGIADYQEIKVTKVAGQYGDDYTVEALKNILPEAERPKEVDYPPMKPAAPSEDTFAPKPTPNPDEINIDDIPF